MAVLHEAGYRCAVPVCRTILTLDIHHIVYVSEAGSDDPSNLLALCGNCHALHHLKKITTESIRAWKFLLMALNEAFDRKSVDLLLALERAGGGTVCTGDGLGDYAGLIASGYLNITWKESSHSDRAFTWGKHQVYLSDKGKAFLEAWKRGDQSAAVGIPSPGALAGS
ncbi:HNH endonuclease [Singulisphaera sp. GP187]|uniref:HNH endonuclease n=1 Tax=Singulisphaera sp. GP187 TaxID=1882752 RepID=UPI001356518B|nr:HNH endonuclease [Singulisphaera sp. GP187]